MSETSTKIVYFRPSRLLVDEDLLDKKYSCLIQDEITGAENSVSVPAYLTLLQHFCALKSPRSKKAKRNDDRRTEFRDKLRVKLIGSSQVPNLSQLVSNVSSIDRIEFHGHIGFEEPVFALIDQLPALQKISFFLEPCKQGRFVESLSSWDQGNGRHHAHNVKSNKTAGSHLVLHSVTCLKIIVKKCDSKVKCPSCCCSQTGNGLQTSMVIRFLKRCKEICPNIKRLSMDIPSGICIKDRVDQLIGEMKMLKPTIVTLEQDQLIVRKTLDVAEPTPALIEAHIPEPMPQACPEQNGRTNNESLNPEIPEKNDNLETHSTIISPLKGGNEVSDENSSRGLDQSESTPYLEDMSKLLGSMLGIPSSASLGSPSSSTSQPQSRPVIKIPLSTHNSSNGRNNNANQAVDNSSNLNDSTKSLTPSSSSVSTETISYAAAAAAAASSSTSTTITTNNNNNTKNIKHLRGTGNDSQFRKGSEGSRRTFVSDGGVLRFDVRNSRNSMVTKKPSMGDLGKPVFSRATTTASSTHHVRSDQ